MLDIISKVKAFNIKQRRYYELKSFIQSIKLWQMKSIVIRKEEVSLLKKSIEEVLIENNNNSNNVKIMFNYISMEYDDTEIVAEICYIKDIATTVYDISNLDFQNKRYEVVIRGKYLEEEYNSAYHNEEMVEF